MSHHKFHFKGNCSKCSEQVEFLTVDRGDAICAQCHVKAARPQVAKFWDDFNWPDRTLFEDEVQHMKKLWVGVLSVSPSGSGKWGK